MPFLSYFGAAMGDIPALARQAFRSGARGAYRQLRRSVSGTGSAMMGAGYATEARKMFPGVMSKLDGRFGASAIDDVAAIGHALTSGANRQLTKGVIGAVAGGGAGYMASDKHPVLGSIGGGLLGAGAGVGGGMLWANRTTAGRMAGSFALRARKALG